MSDTMISAFPDAIRCGCDDSNNAIFYLVSGPGRDDLSARYVNINSEQNNFLHFNENGDFDSFDGKANESNFACFGQSIEDLNSAGRGYHFVTSKTLESSTETIVPWWPDAVRCGGGNFPNSVFFINRTPNIYDPTAWYVQAGQAEVKYVRFDKDGKYYTRSGAEINDESTRGCLGKSISDLYAYEDYHAGKAYNFLNSSGLASDSIIEGWPDAIRCGGLDTPDSVLFLSNVSGSKGHYSQEHPDGVREIFFDGDGNFISETGNTSSCSGKSIEELYTSNAAFNLVTSVSSGNSDMDDICDLDALSDDAGDANNTGSASSVGLITTTVLLSAVFLLGVTSGVYHCFYSGSDTVDSGTYA